jgi:GNAT superfamily N-acetyltransferase
MQPVKSTVAEKMRHMLRLAPPSGESDRAWLADLWRDEWAGETMVSRGRLLALPDLHALIAWDGEARVGAATYDLRDGACELTSLNASPSGRGIGTALLAAAEAAAREAGCRRLRIITTNDNVDALRFYQRRGYRLVAMYPNSLEEARALKPAIPAIGAHGIPLRDELELEKHL